MRIVNLTPHALNIRRADGSFCEIPSTGLARVTQNSRQVAEVDGIAITEATFGEITGLPDPADDVQYVVSIFVLNAAAESGRGARDLVVPDQLIRDTEGRIVGCAALRRLP